MTRVDIGGLSRGGQFMRRRLSRELYALVLLICVHVAVLLFGGSQKIEYHVDEVYSYSIANCVEAERISRVEDLRGHWVQGSDFDTCTVVSDGEQLAFDAAYRNTAIDAHPPLYYWLMHAASSFTPNEFTKWTGIGLNIVAMIVADVLLYLCVRRLIRSVPLRFACVISFGFSAFVIETALFIRMYALLTAFALAFTYLTIRIVDGGVSLSTVLPAALVLYVGGMTHYYFLVFAFWLILLYALVLLARGRIRHLFMYGCSMLGVVIAVFVSFPFAIQQVLGSSTNNVGNEVMGSLFNLELWAIKTADLAHSLFDGFSFWILLSHAAWIFTAVMMIVAAVRTRAYHARSDLAHAPTARYGWWLAGAYALTFLSISKIGGEYVYLRYVSFIFPLLLLPVFMVFDSLIVDNTKLGGAMLCLSALLAVANIAAMPLEHNVSYVYRDSREAKDAVTQYRDRPLVVMVSGEGTAAIMANYTTMREFEHVYISGTGEAAARDVVIGKLNEDGPCVLYIATQSSWAPGFDAQKILGAIERDNPDATHALLQPGNLGSYYLILPANGGITYGE